MTRRGWLAALLLTLVVALPAAAAPSRSQTFFRDKLLTDSATSDVVAFVLRHGGYVVDSIRFRDLTGDDKQDAIVLVDSGGAIGVIGLYIFSSDGKGSGGKLHVAFKREDLVRGATRIRKAGLSFRSSVYAPGDELCCPSKIAESDVRWQDGRFRVTEQREITPLAAPPA